MKKVFSSLTAMLPLFYMLVLVLGFLISWEDEILLSFLGAYTFIGLIVPCLLYVFAANAERKFLAISNIWLYAGNVALFMAEVIFWIVRFEQNRIAEQNGAMEGGLGLVLLILIYLPHWISYLFTRIAGAINCERALRRYCSTSVKTAHSLLQLLPGADLISAIWVWHKVKQDVNT